MAYYDRSRRLETKSSAATDDDSSFEVVNLNDDNGHMSTEARLLSQFPLPPELLGERPLSLEAYQKADDQKFVGKITHYDSTRSLTSGSASAAAPVVPQKKFTRNIDLDALPESLDEEQDAFALQVAAKRAAAAEKDNRRSSLTGARRASSGTSNGSGRKSSVEGYNASGDQKFVKRITAFNSLGPSEFSGFLHEATSATAPMSPVRERSSDPPRERSSEPGPGPALPRHARQTSAPPIIETKNEPESKPDDFFSRIRRISRGRSVDSQSAANPNFNAALAATVTSNGSSDLGSPMSEQSTTESVGNSSETVNPEEDQAFMRRVQRNSGSERIAEESGYEPEDAEPTMEAGAGDLHFVNKIKRYDSITRKAVNQPSQQRTFQPQLSPLEEQATMGASYGTGQGDYYNPGETLDTLNEDDGYTPIAAIPRQPSSGNNFVQKVKRFDSITGKIKATDSSRIFQPTLSQVTEDAAGDLTGYDYSRQAVASRTEPSRDRPSFQPTATGNFVSKIKRFNSITRTPVAPESKHSAFRSDLSAITEDTDQSEDYQGWSGYPAHQDSELYHYSLLASSKKPEQTSNMPQISEMLSEESEETQGYNYEPTMYQATARNELPASDSSNFVKKVTRFNSITRQPNPVAPRRTVDPTVSLGYIPEGSEEYQTQRQTGYTQTYPPRQAIGVPVRGDPNSFVKKVTRFNSITRQPVAPKSPIKKKLLDQIREETEAYQQFEPKVQRSPRPTYEKYDRQSYPETSEEESFLYSGSSASPSTRESPAQSVEGQRSTSNTAFVQKVTRYNSLTGKAVPVQAAPRKPAAMSDIPETEEENGYASNPVYSNHSQASYPTSNYTTSNYAPQTSSRNALGSLAETEEEEPQYQYYSDSKSNFPEVASSSNKFVQKVTRYNSLTGKAVPIKKPLTFQPMGALAENEEEAADDTRAFAENEEEPLYQAHEQRSTTDRFAQPRYNIASDKSVAARKTPALRTLTSLTETQEESQSFGDGTSGGSNFAELASPSNRFVQKVTRFNSLTGKAMPVKKPPSFQPLGALAETEEEETSYSEQKYSSGYAPTSSARSGPASRPQSFKPMGAVSEEEPPYESTEYQAAKRGSGFAGFTGQARPTNQFVQKVTRYNSLTGKAVPVKQPPSFQPLGALAETEEEESYETGNQYAPQKAKNYAPTYPEAQTTNQFVKKVTRYNSLTGKAVPVKQPPAFKPLGSLAETEEETSYNTPERSVPKRGSGFGNLSGQPASTNQFVQKVTRYNSLTGKAAPVKQAPSFKPMGSLAESEEETSNGAGEQPVSKRGSAFAQLTGQIPTTNQFVQKVTRYNSLTGKAVPVKKPPSFKPMGALEESGEETFESRKQAPKRGSAFAQITGQIPSTNDFVQKVTRYNSLTGKAVPVKQPLPSLKHLDALTEVDEEEETKKPAERKEVKEAPLSPTMRTLLDLKPSKQNFKDLLKTTHILKQDGRLNEQETIIVKGLIISKNKFLIDVSKEFARTYDLAKFEESIIKSSSSLLIN